ncbi:MAG: hypothetical protein NVS9B12_01990 [Vulcanimicrobiaceae bacterium]
MILPSTSRAVNAATLNCAADPEGTTCVVEEQLGLLTGQIFSKVTLSTEPPSVIGMVVMPGGTNCVIVASESVLPALSTAFTLKVSVAFTGAATAAVCVQGAVHVTFTKVLWLYPDAFVTAIRKAEVEGEIHCGLRAWLEPVLPGILKLNVTFPSPCDVLAGTGTTFAACPELPEPPPQETKPRVTNSGAIRNKIARKRISASPSIE